MNLLPINLKHSNNITDIYSRSKNKAMNTMKECKVEHVKDSYSVGG